MTDGFHHFHKRKRVHEKLEPYPNPNKLKRFIDFLIYLGGILGPLFTVPQLTKIWFDKNATGVSVISWGGYTIGAIFWVMYGVIHKEKAIIFTYGIWVILDLFIFIGVLIFN